MRRFTFVILQRIPRPTKEKNENVSTVSLKIRKKMKVNTFEKIQRIFRELQKRKNERLINVSLKNQKKKEYLLEITQRNSSPETYKRIKMKC